MSEILAGAGVLAAALAAAATILLPAGRARSATMAAALVLFPVLIFADQWHSPQIEALREDTARVVLALALGSAALAALAWAFRRWPVLIPLAVIAALPFRVPLESGGDTANLLVPLYFVIAAAVLATAVRDCRPSLPRESVPVRPGPGAADPPGGDTERDAENGATPRPQASPSVAGPPDRRGTEPAGRAVRGVLWLLAASVVLYALQSWYSPDFSKALQNLCFFYVPFALVLALFRDVAWDRRMLVLALWVVGVSATAFVLVGTVEYATRSLFWNDAVIRSNEFHTYFRVNSVFWDPNIYGRYLALAIVVATAPLLWIRERRGFALLTVLVGILWFGLAQTFSESSYISLLAGLAVLASLRWNWRWTLAAVAVGIVAIGAIVAGSGKLRWNIIFSGRADLVEGGVELWTERPLWGYGSGSFQAAYREHRADEDKPVTVSHTEPVTVLAEQGLLGAALYLALIVAALWMLGAGMWARSGGGERAPPYAGRGAALAAFVALLVHTLAYAVFLEDPITWVLLAIGSVLALAAAREAPVREPA